MSVHDSGEPLCDLAGWPTFACDDYAEVKVTVSVGNIGERVQEDGTTKAQEMCSVAKYCTYHASVVTGNAVSCGYTVNTQSLDSGTTK